MYWAMNLILITLFEVARAVLPKTQITEYNFCMWEE